MKKNKILITGTSRGIGKALSEYYLNEGHQVWGCSRSESSIKHGSYTHYSLDLMDEKQVLGMFDLMTKSEFDFDVLINNAGKASFNSFMMTPFETVQKVMGLNVNGLFLVSREAAKLMMINKKKGRIVNISSVAAAQSLAGEAIYAASKSAVESLTKTMARELAKSGITVNSLGVSLYKSDLSSDIVCDKLQEVLNKQPLARWAKTSDITHTIDYFISPQSDFITGQSIYLAGIK